jgi:dTDP-4-dehydrorhamnose reductase
MRVFVAGHKGMLGHVAARYFAEQGYEVVTSDHRYTASPRDPLVEAIRDSGSGWVVNALGKIKQKCGNADELFRANTLFPLHVKRRLAAEQRLIHASTDCVFSGRTGPYQIEMSPDPDDDYGLSKMLGEAVAEPGRAYVLRTSIVGPELAGQSGLLGWFLNQRGTVNGFVNHMWNGVTTLEWSKACLDLMAGRQTDQAALWQVGVWPPVSKFELLGMFARAWNHVIDIVPKAATDAIDRSLQPTWQRATLEEQLLELSRWYSASEESSLGSATAHTR